MDVETGQETRNLNREQLNESLGGRFINKFLASFGAAHFSRQTAEALLHYAHELREGPNGAFILVLEEDSPGEPVFHRTSLILQSEEFVIRLWREQRSSAIKTHEASLRFSYKDFEPIGKALLGEYVSFLDRPRDTILRIYRDGTFSYDKPVA